MCDFVEKLKGRHGSVWDYWGLLSMEKTKKKASSDLSLVVQFNPIALGGMMALIRRSFVHFKCCSCNKQSWAQSTFRVFFCDCANNWKEKKQGIVANHKAAPFPMRPHLLRLLTRVLCDPISKQRYVQYRCEQGLKLNFQDDLWSGHSNQIQRWFRTFMTILLYIFGVEVKKSWSVLDSSDGAVNWRHLCHSRRIRNQCKTVWKSC